MQKDKGKGKHKVKGAGKDQDVSRALSWILRHGAIHGYIHLDQVMQYLRSKGNKDVTYQRIQLIVQNNDKKRFEIEERKQHKFIRATQGHSMKEVSTEELLKKIVNAQEYPVVVHGTFRKFWPLIKQYGLKRMTRNHIHFAPGMPKEEGVVSGMRGTCDVIIQIDLAAAIKEGIQFYISSNHVILTEGVQGVLSPKFFKRVTRKDGSVMADKEEGGQVQKKQQKQEKYYKQEKQQKKEKQYNNEENKQKQQERQQQGKQ